MEFLCALGQTESYALVKLAFNGTVELDVAEPWEWPYSSSSTGRCTVSTGEKVLMNSDENTNMQWH